MLNTKNILCIYNMCMVCIKVWYWKCLSKIDLAVTFSPTQLENQEEINTVCQYIISFFKKTCHLCINLHIYTSVRNILHFSGQIYYITHQTANCSALSYMIRCKKFTNIKLYISLRFQFHHLLTLMSEHKRRYFKCFFVFSFFFHGVQLNEV